MIFLRPTLRASLSGLLFLLTLAAGLPARAEPQSIDAIIAVVNDGVILQSELEHGIAQAHHVIQERGMTSPPEGVLRSQVLERLVLLRLQTQRANEAGIKVDDGELNEVINNIAAQNKLTLPQFNEELKKEGMDYLGMREQIRDEMLIQRVRQKEVASRVLVTDQDINLYLSNQGGIADETEYHLAHILVAVPDGASPEVREKARAKATGLLKRLHDGEDFGSVAVANSDGQQALQGGDLDWRKSGNLPTIFATVVPKMHDNQISDLIEGANGFNIIKLLGTRIGGQQQTVTETHARHILVQPNPLRDENATRALAEELAQRLKKGEDWTTLAKKYSDDPGSKNGGGDLGWQAPGVFTPEFQVRVDELKPNEISEPFHTQFGWHVAEVLDRRTRDATEDSRRQRARQAISQRKEAEEYDSWLRRLREEAYIEYRPLAGAPTDPDSKKS